MKRILVGKYQLGFRMVSLYLDPKIRGAFFNRCIDEQEPHIVVGMLDYNLDQSFGALSHEVLELSMQDMNCVFSHNPCFETGASDCYLFVMNHNQFTEVASRTGWFLFKCFGDFCKKFQELRKSEKKLPR